MTTAQHIDAVREARKGLFAHLRELSGPERAEGLRQALAAGFGASELARGVGISRARLYQLLGQVR